MAASLFLPFSMLDSNGNPISGAKLNCYAEGTTARQTVYQDESLSTAHANPVVSDASGRFGPVYLQALPYKFVLTDADDNTLLTFDNYNPDGGTVSITDLPDSVTRIVDNADGTKKIAFEAGGITTGTTRTITVPDADITLIGAASTDTLTNKTINLANNTLTGTTAGFNTALSDGDFATLAGTETLTNKTLTSPVLNTSLSGTAFLDEDDFASDAADKVASQQSIKAYVDANSGRPAGIKNVIDDFGATGDGIVLADAAITSGDATLTSATASFVAGDVGKLITVDGAGAAGAHLSTTIASINSSTSVELSVSAGTTVAGARCVYGTNDTTALQNALNSRQIVAVPPGNYCTNDELVLGRDQRSAGLVGLAHASQYPETTQSGGPTWGGGDEPVIIYCGSPTTAASPKSVLRVATAATGTEPAQTFAGSVYCGPVDQIMFDANSRAYVGLYYARVMGVNIGYVQCKRAVGHGFLMAHCFSGTVRHVNAFRNLGCGITIGGFETTDGTTQTWPLDWTTSQINAMRFGYLQAAANGQDGTFDDATNERWGYGVGIFTHRANMFDTILSELNDGVGLYFSPTGTANTIDTLYTELNSGLTTDATGGTAIAEGRADDGYSIWFEGRSDASSQHAVINNVFAYTSRIKITGTEPSRFPEGAFTLRNVSNGDAIYADWDNWRIENASNEAVGDIVGHLPAANDRNSISLDTPLTTLYVRSGGADSNNGRTSGTAFLTLQKAIDMAKVCTDVTTIDCAGTTLVTEAIDLRGLERDITITGGTINQSGSGSYGLDITGGRGECTLTLASLTQLQTMRVTNASVILTGVTTWASANTAATSHYLLALRDKAELTITANVQATANGARGVLLEGGSQLNIPVSWRIDNTTLAANGGIIPTNGGGVVRANYAYASANSAWVKNFTANSAYLGNVFFTDEIMNFNSGDITTDIANAAIDASFPVTDTNFTFTLVGESTAGTTGNTAANQKQLKVGRAVSVWFDCDYNAFDGTGALKLTGLPVAPDVSCWVPVGNFDANGATTFDVIYARLVSASTEVTLWKKTSGGVMSRLADTDVNGSAGNRNVRLSGTITYRANV